MKQKYLWITVLSLPNQITKQKIKQDLLSRNVLWLKKYPECLELWTLKTPKAINREFIDEIKFFFFLNKNVLKPIGKPTEMTLSEFPNGTTWESFESIRKHSPTQTN